MPTFDDWKAHGERIAVDLGGQTFHIWTRRQGSGPTLTLLHGFPTSSFDWAETIAQLPDFDILTLDFLGFGDSDKPADHLYSIHEQANIVEAVWSHFGIRATDLVVHDYAVSVTQELLARRLERRLTVDLGSAVFLNGGIYPDLHRALPAQEALLDPEKGPVISQMVTEETYTASLLMTFPPARQPSAATLHELWRCVENRDGHRIGYRLIRYMLDRRQYAARWTSALEKTDVARRFVWGMLDPISGGHVVPRIRERMPGCPVVCLDDVGHWPALEKPDAVVAAIRASTVAAH
ncbi:MAG: alpha/beta hydrolase [Deltaproteobacteria bacterium]|nr:alpha/beta hydrolase [Deltaproteobacteria bacterium]